MIISNSTSNAIYFESFTYSPLHMVAKTNLNMLAHLG